MTKLALTGLALASCLALTSCNTTPKIRFASAFDYPEGQAYVDCIVDHAKKRAFDNPEWFKNDDLDVPIIAGYHACEAAELKLHMRARADGMPITKLGEFTLETRTKAWKLAWDEVIRVRMERLKAMGAIR